MKYYIAAFVATFVFTGCATSTSDKGTTQGSSKTASSESFSNTDLISIMLGGGARDEAKFAERLEAAKAHPLGSKLNPVRVHMPQGQQAYLRRLNCDNGATPEFNRAGSFGAGPYDTIIDGYELTCSGASIEGLVFMDMYHPGHVEEAAIPGFTID